MNKTTIGGLIVLLFILCGVFAPAISTHNPNHMALSEAFNPPSAQHFFGQDENGGDIFSQVIYGARLSLQVSFSVVSFGLILGLLIGSFAGYLGGKFDFLIMRIIDIVQAFPGFLLALSIVAVLGSSVKNLILALCLTSWVGFARMVRAEILFLRKKDYVTSAKSLGAHPLRQLVFHIWPNLAGVLLVNASFSFAAVILAESGLSFLGLGAPLGTASWGALINSGRYYLFEAPHLSLFPGLAIVLSILGLNLLGDGLRDKLEA